MMTIRSINYSTYMKKSFIQEHPDAELPFN